MLSEIYYFSGTGNCLAAARMINKKSAVKSEIIFIPAIKSRPFIKAERVGFIFPVFCHKIPDIVKRFILKMDFTSLPYIYAVATHAGEVGQSLFDVQTLLDKKGQHLSLGIALDMPGNAVETSHAINMKRLALLEQKAAKTAELIDARKEGVMDGNNGLWEHIRNQFIGLAAWNYIFDPKRFKLTTHCTGCGICEKICPVDNIHLVNHKPEWRNMCAACLACFHWCPNEAVYMNNFIIKKRSKYHHPDITINDMVLAKQRRVKN